MDKKVDDGNTKDVENINDDGNTKDVENINEEIKEKTKAKRKVKNEIAEKTKDNSKDETKDNIEDEVKEKSKDETKEDETKDETKENEKKDEVKEKSKDEETEAIEDKTEETEDKTEETEDKTEELDEEEQEEQDDEDDFGTVSGYDDEEVDENEDEEIELSDEEELDDENEIQLNSPSFHDISRRKNKKPKEKKKTEKSQRGKPDGNLIVKFLMSLVISLMCFSIIVICGVYAYSQLYTEAPPTIQEVLPEPDFTIQGQNYDDVDTSNPLKDSLVPPVKTNFLITGTDQGNLLTDVIIVGSFDRDEREIDLISIPRDTLITMSSDEIKSLNEIGRYVPSNGKMNINHVHSYAGKDVGMLYLQRQIERMFEIKIHYYASVQLDAFRQIVDDIGGVPMEIPSGGLYYSDPEQNLTISVPSGYQLLDGRMAEGVVRYRATYVQGDIQRVEVQQDFLKAMFNKVLSTETLISSAPQLIATFLTYVNTNFTLQDIPKYIPYINQLATSSLNTETMPFHWIRDASYVLPDEDGIDEMVQRVFYTSIPVVDEIKEEDEEDGEDEETQDSKLEDNENSLDIQSDELDEPVQEEIDISSFNIQVLNGGKTVGMAGAYSKLLESEGYNITTVADYKGTQNNITRIWYKEGNEQIANLLAPYLDNPLLETDNSLNSTEIIIVIGIDEKVPN